MLRSSGGARQSCRGDDVSTRGASQETSHYREWGDAGGQEAAAQEKGPITQWLHRSVLAPSGMEDITSQYLNKHAVLYNQSFPQTDDRDLFRHSSQQVTDNDLTIRLNQGLILVPLGLILHI